MRVLFEKLHSFLVLRTAFVVVFLCVIGFSLITGSALRGKTGFSAMQTTFSVTKMEAILAEWGTEGVSAYLKSMYVDFIFPIAYAITLASAVALISTPKEKAASPAKYALFFFTLPLFAGVCDLMENGFHLIMLQQPQALDVTLTFLAATAASIKYVLMIVTILAIAIYGVQRIRNRRPTEA